MTDPRHPLAVSFVRAAELTSLSKQTLRRFGEIGSAKDDFGDHTTAGYSLRGFK